MAPKWPDAWVLLAAAVAASAAAESPVTFDAALFTAAQREGRTIIVETYAPWCLPCRVRGPVLRDILRRERYRAILFLRVGEKTVDADWKRIGAKRYGMLHIYKGPQRVAAGAATREDEIVAMLERAR